MNTKLIGGILLVTGTTIGGGVLALPVISAGKGFMLSSLLLIACWFAMLIPALLILEVNLCLPTNSNLVSMARITLGKAGALITWLVYLLLLYSLLAVYISSGADIVAEFAKLLAIPITLWVSVCLFVLIFGFIVYKGVQSVDYVNRGLMLAKLLSYLLLITFTIPFVNFYYLGLSHLSLVWQGIMVMMTSFGFATIIPTLRSYFSDDHHQLRFVIIVGSIIPLICYLLWNFAIIGVLKTTGLMQLSQSMTPAVGLVKALQYQLHQSHLTDLAHLFVSVCILTSFLAVSLGLTDFLADGLKINKLESKGIVVYLLAFVPPLLMVIFKPNLFIAGLHYAGICCIILLMLSPIMMAWRARYHLLLSGTYRVAGGKFLLVSIAIIAIALLLLGLHQLTGLSN